MSTEIGGLCVQLFSSGGGSQDTPRSAESPGAAVTSPLLQSVVTVNNKGRAIFLGSNNKTQYTILKMLYTKKNATVQIF